MLPILLLELIVPSALLYVGSNANAESPKMSVSAEDSLKFSVPDSSAIIVILFALPVEFEANSSTYVPVTALPVRLPPPADIAVESEVPPGLKLKPSCWGVIVLLPQLTVSGSVELFLILNSLVSVSKLTEYSLDGVLLFPNSLVLRAF